MESNNISEYFKTIEELKTKFLHILQGIVSNPLNTVVKEGMNELLSMYDKALSSKEVQTANWQLCPKCNGQGAISKPPYVAGDVNQWSSTSSIFTCDVCNGAKIIAPVILKEIKENEKEETKI